MSRRLFAIALLAGLVPVLTGCSSCGDRPGLLTRLRSKCAPCQTVGRSECCDTVIGQPVSGPLAAPATVIPGGSTPYPPIGTIPGAPAAPAPELHMPSPSDLIRPPAVPVPAPGDASLPLPTSPGVPVKNK